MSMSAEGVYKENTQYIYRIVISSVRGIVAHAHLKTLHGGVGLTMSRVRERYWIPRIRRLAKRCITQCNGCKRFHAIAFANPPACNLPKDRVSRAAPFQVLGVDYAGPIKYRKKTKCRPTLPCTLVV